MFVHINFVFYELFQKKKSHADSCKEVHKAMRKETIFCKMKHEPFLFFSYLERRVEVRKKFQRFLETTFPFCMFQISYCMKTQKIKFLWIERFSFCSDAAFHFCLSSSNTRHHFWRFYGIQLWKFNGQLPATCNKNPRGLRSWIKKGTHWREKYSVIAN